MALTEKQKTFCKEYVVDLNATQAAIRAGYAPNGMNKRVTRMMANDGIKNYIKELMDKRSQRTEITADDVLRELQLIAFSKATDFAKVVEKQAMAGDGVPVPLFDADGNPVMYRTVELELTENLTEEQQRVLANVKRGRDGLEAKPHDKVRALELMGRHLGMWNDKIDVNGAMDLKVVVDYGDEGN